MVQINLNYERYESNKMGNGLMIAFFRVIMEVFSEMMYELIENNKVQSFEDLEQERCWQINH